MQKKTYNYMYDFSVYLARSYLDSKASIGDQN